MLTKEYRKASLWVCDTVENLVDENGQLSFEKSTFADALLCLAPGISLVPASEGVHVFRVDDALASWLVVLAEEHHQFYDLCVQILEINMVFGGAIPKTLGLFAAKVLRGEQKRPTPPHRERVKNWNELSFLYSLTKSVQREFGLSLTRNDASEKTSACDAVAEGLTVCGRQTSYSWVKSIMTHPDHEIFRKEIEAADRIRSKKYHAASNLNALMPYDRSHQKNMADAVVMDILRTFPPDR